MAYSPIEQGRLLGQPQLSEVAARHDATPRNPNTRENAEALDLNLSEEAIAALDAAFPPPAGPQPREML